MRQEIREASERFMDYMKVHGYLRAGGSIDGTTGNLSLGMRESRRGERTHHHETPAIRVDFEYIDGVLMIVRDCLETPVKSLQAMERGTSLLHRVHDWAREHGTITNEERNQDGIFVSKYRIK